MSNNFKHGVIKIIDGQQVYIPFKKEKEIISGKYNMLDTFEKFGLLPNSKCPSNEWSISENTDRKKMWSKTKKATSRAGIGIPTGKVNNCFVVDLDEYKWDETHPFIKKYGKGDYHNKFSTYVQQSAGGAWHLFFQYDEEFFNKCHNGLGIDILSDRNSEGFFKGKYVVGAGTTIRFNDDMKIKR